MTRFRLTLAAEEDLAAIEIYLSERSNIAAESVLDDLEATCQLLAQHPGVGRHRGELGPEVMSFPVGSYVVFYTGVVVEDAVIILRVLHGSRDIPAVFE